MISWIKYFPIHLRTDFQSTDYKGPSFTHAKPVTLIAGGSVIRLKAPKHKSNLGEPPFYLKNEDGMKRTFRRFNPSQMANNNWVSSLLLARRWSYWKAWFAGTKGELFLSVSIVKRDEQKVLDGASFFQPSTFEYVVANYLDTHYGSKNDSGRPLYRAPVNWIVHHNLPVFSASFEVTGDTNELYFVFPVSDQCFIDISFRYSGNREVLQSEMESIARQMINSVSLELSSEAQAQWNKVKSSCPDMSLTDTFAPLKWPVKPEDIGKGENLESGDPQDEIFGIY